MRSCRSPRRLDPNPRRTIPPSQPTPAAPCLPSFREDRARHAQLPGRPTYARASVGARHTEDRRAIPQYRAVPPGWPAAYRDEHCAVCLHHAALGAAHKRRLLPPSLRDVPLTWLSHPLTLLSRPLTLLSRPFTFLARPPHLAVTSPHLAVTSAHLTVTSPSSCCHVVLSPGISPAGPAARRVPLGARAHGRLLRPPGPRPLQQARLPVPLPRQALARRNLNYPASGTRPGFRYQARLPLELVRLRHGYPARTPRGRRVGAATHSRPAWPPPTCPHPPTLVGAHPPPRPRPGGARVWPRGQRSEGDGPLSPRSGEARSCLP